MRRLLTPAAAATALALFASSASAATPSFDDVDLDGNGIVTRGEFVNAMPDATLEDFAIIDTDSDGMISEDELSAAAEIVETPKS